MLQRSRNDFHGDGGDGEVTACGLDHLAVAAAQVLETGDVGVFLLRDVRDVQPGSREVLGRLATHRAHRHALDLAPLGEVGQRFGRDARAAEAAGFGGHDDALRMLLHVVV